MLKVLIFAVRFAKKRRLIFLLYKYIGLTGSAYVALAFTLSQFIKAFFSWKAGAKVAPFQIYSKLKSLFF